MQTHFEFCRSLLAKENPDLYHIALMAKSPRQIEALWASFAFIHEVSKTRTLVSETTMGLIRLQWWRDELDKIFSQQPHAASEVLAALKESIVNFDIKQSDLLDHINAYDDELRQTQPPSKPLEVLDILKAQHTPVIKFAAAITKETIAPSAIDALAVNRGLVDILRRAKDKSVVAMHKDNFICAFDTTIKVKGRILNAFRIQSLIRYKRQKRLSFNPNNPYIHMPEPLALLRLWTSLIGK